MNTTDTVSGFAGAASLSFYIHHWIKKRDVKDDFGGSSDRGKEKGLQEPQMGLTCRWWGWNPIAL